MMENKGNEAVSSACALLVCYGEGALLNSVDNWFLFP